MDKTKDICVKESNLKADPIKNYSEYFNIYRSKKGFLIPNLNKIVTQNAYLKNKNIFNHLIGRSIFYFFLTKETDIFGIEIDLHGEYLSLESRQYDRLNKYNFIIEYLPIPSLVFQSSDNMGLHCYWKLNDKIPFGIIKPELLKLFDLKSSELKKNGIEIKPTPTTLLKLPYAIQAGGLLLDAETLQPIYTQTDISTLNAFFEDAAIYDYSETFGRIPAVDKKIFNHKSNKKIINSYKHMELREKYDNKIRPIVNKKTNEAILQLSFNHFINKLSIHESSDIINHYFKLDNVTRKADTTNEAIYSRVKAEYKRLKQKKYEKKESHPSEKALYLFENSYISDITNKLYSKHENYFKGKISKKKLSYFLLRVMRWTEYIKTLSDDVRKQISYTEYNYFYYNTKIKKLTPLPKSFLHYLASGWYIYILDILIKEGLIILKQRYFKDKNNMDSRGTCNYYEVNF